MTTCILKPSWNDPSRILLAIAGTSIAASSAGLVYRWAIAPSNTPQYEGRIQIRLEEIDDVWSSIEDSTSTATPTDESTHLAPSASRVAAGGTPENFQPEYSNLELQASFLTSPEVIKPALEHLREQGIHLTYGKFSQNFVLQPTDRQTLEAIYQGHEAQVVSQVLEAIAQTYLQQGRSCQATVCQNFEYVQMQMHQANQRLHQLQAKIQQFEQQHSIAPSSSTRRSPGSVSEALHHQLISTQEQHRQALQRFREMQQELGLSPNHAAAPEILARSPSYQDHLDQWKQIDRRWLDHKVSLPNSAPYELEANPGQLTTLPSRPPSRVEELEEQRDHLRDQLNDSIDQTVQTLGLDRMPHDLREAVVRRPQRLEALKPWLIQAQQVYLLQSRQHNLTELAQRLQPRIQQWQATQATYRNLQRQAHVAQETMTRYRRQYEVLYPQVMPRQTAWQLVSFPEVAIAASQAR